MKKNSATLIALILTGVVTLQAQIFIPKALREDNQAIRSISKRIDEAGWIYLKDEAGIGPNDLFSVYKADMGLGNDDEMILEKSKEDEFGYMHNKYTQYYKGVRVEGAEYYEHLKGCIVKYAHGKLLEQPTGRNATPAIAESEALTNALLGIGANT